MTDMSTTYDGSGGVNTRTSGAVYPTFDPSQNPLVQFAYKVAQARLARQQQMQQQAAAPAPRMAAPEPVRREQPQEPAVNKLADYMDARKRIIEDQEAAAPPPMRMVSGPGIVPGYTPDVNSMSANQRRIYLPQQSQQQQTPWATRTEIDPVVHDESAWGLG